MRWAAGWTVLQAEWLLSELSWGGTLLNPKVPRCHTCIYNYSTEGSRTIAKAFQRDSCLKLAQWRRLLIPKVYCGYFFTECRKHYDVVTNLDSS